MHIQERNNTTLTTCTKMTEEVDRRHGMNGNSGSKGVSDENSPQGPVPHNNSTSGGGRLKFFKDGKFILELARAREGERGGWVSVPQKTFWPPTSSVPAAQAAMPPSHIARQERATSLSVSDDNSSVQSSPWQRDHCWKQPSPRRNVSRELCMLYVRPSSLSASVFTSPHARRKRRRPHDVTPVQTQNNSLNGYGSVPRLANGSASHDEHRSEDTTDGAADIEPERLPRVGKFKYHRRPSPRVYKKTKMKRERRDIDKIADALRERGPVKTTVDSKVPVAAVKREHFTVSPRKRILERVSLEDRAGKKKTVNVSPSQPGPSRAPDRPPVTNGLPRRERTSKPVSSYSIVSILSMPEEPESRRRSPPPPPPPAAPPGLESPLGAASPDPVSEHYRRAPSWARSPRLRSSPLPYCSPGPSGSVSPAGHRPPPDRPAAVKYPYPDMSYRHHETILNPPYQLYPPPMAAYHHVAAGPYYAGYAPRSQPVWVFPPAPWVATPTPHPLITDRPPGDDASSDLPLNLSKR